MVAGSGEVWGALRWLSHVSSQLWVTQQLLPNGSFQSCCQLLLPQPKITTTNNINTIKKFKYILNHLVINRVQLVSGVLCAAVWSPWRHCQHHSAELMSSGCVLSTDLAASLCSSSGPAFLGSTPTSEAFLPLPAGSRWNAQSSPEELHLRGCVKAGLSGMLPHPAHPDSACLVGCWVQVPSSVM